MPRLNVPLVSIAAAACVAFGTDSSAQSTPGAVLDEMLITEGVGGFAGALELASSFGSAVAPIGDLDEDGRVELAVGAPGTNDVWILFFGADGKVRAQTRLDSPSVPPFAWSFRNSLASVGDLDGDGVEELAVGDPYYGDSSLDGPGAVWILFLDHDASVKSSLKIGVGVGGFVGPLPANAQFGMGVAAIGDLDGNGVTELAVGSPGDSDGSPLQQPEEVGALWILFLAPNGSVLAEQKISAHHGGFPGPLGPGANQFGASVALLGDLDQEGTPDVAVGAVADFGQGGTPSVWIVSIRSDGTVGAATQIKASDLDEPIPDDAEFGWAVAGPGDIDGNGVRDLVVGSPVSWTGGGSIWVLFLQRDATAEHSLRIGEFAGGFPGSLEPKDLFGSALGAIRMNGAEDVLTLVVGAAGTGDELTPFGLDEDFTGGVWLLTLDAGAPKGSWTWVEGALAGSNGLPALAGEGPLVAGTEVTLSLTKAAPQSPAVLIVGLSALQAPFLGGTLVPSTDVLVGALQTNANGKLTLAGDWPPGIPAGQSIYFQIWIEDETGPQGYAASNAVAATAP